MSAPGRLAVVARVIGEAFVEGISLPEIAERCAFPDGGARQVAPLAWWLAHTGQVQMARDCARFRPWPCVAGCGIPLDPVLTAQGWRMHPACEFAELAA